MFGSFRQARNFIIVVTYSSDTIPGDCLFTHHRILMKLFPTIHSFFGTDSINGMRSTSSSRMTVATTLARSPGLIVSVFIRPVNTYSLSGVHPLSRVTHSSRRLHLLSQPGGASNPLTPGPELVDRSRRRKLYCSLQMRQGLQAFLQLWLKKKIPTMPAIITSNKSKQNPKMYAVVDTGEVPIDSCSYKTRQGTMGGCQQ